MRTNGRFAMALHILAVLAYKDGDKVSSDFLSQSVNTNPVIIRRLLRRLQKARLVDTRKGPGAGSRLSRSAARISLAQVYSAVDESALFAMPRRKPNGNCPVGHKIRAVLEPIFFSAQGALEKDLAGITLAALMASIRSDSRPRAPGSPSR